MGRELRATSSNVRRGSVIAAATYSALIQHPAHREAVTCLREAMTNYSTSPKA